MRTQPAAEVLHRAGDLHELPLVDGGTQITLAEPGQAQADVLEPPPVPHGVQRRRLSTPALIHHLRDDAAEGLQVARRGMPDIDHIRPVFIIPRQVQQEIQRRVDTQPLQLAQLRPLRPGPVVQERLLQKRRRSTGCRPCHIVVHLHEEGSLISIMPPSHQVVPERNIAGHFHGDGGLQRRPCPCRRVRGLGTPGQSGEQCPGALPVYWPCTVTTGGAASSSPYTMVM